MEEEEQQESSPTAQALKSRHSIRCASTLYIWIFKYKNSTVSSSNSSTILKLLCSGFENWRERRYGAVKKQEETYKMKTWHPFDAKCKPK